MNPNEPHEKNINTNTNRNTNKKTLPLNIKLQYIIQLAILIAYIVLLNTKTPEEIVLENALGLTKVLHTFIISRIIVYLPVLVIVTTIILYINQKTKQLTGTYRTLQAIEIAMIITMII